ncbi:MAG: hypothetical protein A3F18_08145 [Legionellales bacterium RIFCSPHIGHO2_12_FULL_37_14]|nr:MAG: hypothetical protein A3F18_08145 [Legionellales bacterium RIFCSPHIGHO2_12_FULL_37_14]
MTLSAYEAGFLASAYYYVYATLQVPVGMLFDKKSVRMLLTLNALICSIGCISFAYSNSLVGLTVSRLIMGTGSAFAFVGVAHILRVHFEVKEFGFMIGLSETLAFLATVIFMFIMAIIKGQVLWRSLMFYSGICGLIITLFCFFLLPKEPPASHSEYSVLAALGKLCLDKVAWFNGLYIGAGFGVITVFGAMWAIPFIQLKTGCNIKIASVVDAALFLGAGFGCPLYGKLELYTKSRKWMMFLAYFITAILFLLTLFAATTSIITMSILMFAIGIISASYIVTFNIANEIAPPKAASTSAGFTNMFGVLTAPLLQPFIGYLLDSYKHGSKYTLIDYQISLLVIPISLLIAAVLGFYLPEKE